MTELALRDYRPDDAEAMAAIYAHYVKTSIATFDFEAPDLAATAAKYAAMLERGHPVLVGEADGRLVGYAYASDYRPRLGYRFTCEDTIYLHPDAAGRGYGKLLLGALIERAAACGFRQMLAVISDDTGRSVRLHERFGFVVRGTFPGIGHKFDRWLDVVHMQRGL